MYYFCCSKLLLVIQIFATVVQCLYRYKVNYFLLICCELPGGRNEKKHRFTIISNIFLHCFVETTVVGSTGNLCRILFFEQYGLHLENSAKVSVAYKKLY